MRNTYLHFNLELIPFKIEVEDLGLRSINISWSQTQWLVAISNVTQTFNLTVSNGTWEDTISLSEPYYNFTALESSSECEIYSILVTATFKIKDVNYSWKGCSVTSTNHTMLPSLPNVDILQSSLKQSLMKEVMNITLTVFFKVSESN